MSKSPRSHAVLPNLLFARILNGIPMQLGIFAKTFVRPTLVEALDAVVGHGLNCIQFNFACAGLPSMPEHIAPELAGQMAREIQQRNLAVAAVSGTFNMIHPEAQKRQG